MNTRTPLAPTLTLGLLALTAPLLAAEPMRLDEPASTHVVAELRTDGGRLVFVEETVDGEFGFGIFEQGNVDLAPFYEMGASALEIYLALAPAGSEVPDALVRAHALARALDPSVPETPRRLSGRTLAQKAVSYYGFAQDTSNCWGWGDVAVYDSLIGNEPGTWGGHESSDAHDAFVTWSQVPGGTINTTNATFFEQEAEWADQFYATPWGHERAVAMCVTHAIVAPGESEFDCEDRSSPYYNNVNYRVRLRGQQGSDTWYSDHEFLNAYGEGVRYRSSSTASRKYTLEVVDVSIGSIICREQYEVFLRSRWNPPIGS